MRHRIPREITIASAVFIAGGLAASVVGALQVYNLLELSARVASPDLVPAAVFEQPLQWLIAGGALLASGVGVRLRSVATYVLAIGTAAGVGGVALMLARSAWDGVQAGGWGIYAAVVFVPASMLLLIAAAYSLAAVARNAPWHTSARGKLDVAPARAVLGVLAVVAAVALAVGVLIAQGQRDVAEAQDYPAAPGAECEKSADAGFECESP